MTKQTFAWNVSIPVLQELATVVLEVADGCDTGQVFFPGSSQEFENMIVGILEHECVNLSRASVKEIEHVFFNKMRTTCNVDRLY